MIWARSETSNSRTDTRTIRWSVAYLSTTSLPAMVASNSTTSTTSPS
ncbi:hypothetical protein [Lentzea albidocapillata]|nr:hypothetical protein [Lentzea albidocapillata]